MNERIARTGVGRIRSALAPTRADRMLRVLMVGAMMAALGGCGGDSGTNPVPASAPASAQPGAANPGGDSNTPPAAGGDPNATPAPGGGTPGASGGGTATPSSITPTWYGVQAKILQQYCTVCHSGASAPTGLSWEVDRYAAIVTDGRMSTEIPTMREIEPGNPDASYLLWKLRGQGPAGQAVVGVRMPAFSAALDPALIAVVEEWIRAGAPIGVPSDADSGGTATPPPADGGTTPPAPTGSGTTPAPSAITPTWYGVQAKILQQYCTVCHSGASAPAGLSWEVDRYAAIVTNGHMSTEITTMKEIDPGNPDSSYILWKLRGQGPAGQAIVGVRMPAFGAALDPALIAVVEEWIRAGAPLGVPSDADSGPAPTPPPADGGTPTPPPGGTPTASSIIPTWYGVQAKILQQYCTACHNGAGAPAGLSWEVDRYAAVVTNGHMSTEVPTLREVDPGNPDTSYMLWKLRGQGPAGQAIVGLRMPAAGPALDPALIAVVEEWIRAGAPLGNPEDATAGGPPPPSPIVPTWYGIQVNILEKSCTLCHNGPNSPGGLSWELDRYTEIVTNARMSTEIPTLREVDAGNPDTSYMLWKLRGHGPNGEPIVGVRMPATGFFIDPEQIAVIEQWIRDGAPLGTILDAVSGGGGGGSPYPVGSWKYVWNETLQACTMCHSPTPSSTRCGVDFACPPKGVVLTIDNFSGIVDGSIVRPFQPENSKLWQRVNDPDPAKRMPFDLNPLLDRQLEILFNWISAGAPLCPAGQTCP